MIKANKLRWYDWERHSTLKGKMKFGGLIGSITYEGKFDKFLLLLKLGKFIHIGKNTTFGLGKYKINVNV
jgi:CRISPR/Cas system endoribonuclease Cas6 (RAMP superfamily)